MPLLLAWCEECVVQAAHGQSADAQVASLRSQKQLIEEQLMANSELHQSQISRLEADVAALRCELEAAKNAAARTVIESALTDGAAAQEHESKVSECLQLRTELGSVRADCDNMVTENMSLESHVDELVGQLEAMRKQVAGHESGDADAEQQVELLESRLELLTVEYEGLNKSLTAKEVEMGQMKEDMTAAAFAHDSLKSKFDDADAEKTSLEQQLASKVAECQLLRSELDAERSEADEVEGLMKELDESRQIRSDSISQKVAFDNLSSQKDAVETKLGASIRECDFLEVQLQSLRTEIQLFKGTCDENEGFKAQAEALTSELRDVTVEKE